MEACLDVSFSFLPTHNGIPSLSTGLPGPEPFLWIEGEAVGRSALGHAATRAWPACETVGDPAHRDQISPKGVVTYHCTWQGWDGRGVSVEGRSKAARLQHYVGSQIVRRWKAQTCLSAGSASAVRLNRTRDGPGPAATCEQSAPQREARPGRRDRSPAVV